MFGLQCVSELHLLILSVSWGIQEGCRCIQGPAVDKKYSEYAPARHLSCIDQHLDKLKHTLPFATDAWGHWAVPLQLTLATPACISK